MQIELPDASAQLQAVRAIAYVHEATIFGRSIHALVEDNHIDDLRARLPQAAIQRIEPSLEDIFVTLTYRIMEKQP